MRIDLFLKESRLIKRRKIANDATTNGLVSINGIVCKPSTKVKIDDTIVLNLGLKEITVKVVSLKSNKDTLMYELINEQYKGQKA